MNTLARETCKPLTKVAGLGTQLPRSVPAKRSGCIRTQYVNRSACFHVHASSKTKAEASRIVPKAASSDGMLAMETDDSLDMIYKKEGWQKMGLQGRAVSVGTAVALAALVADQAIPSPIRLAVMSYALATTAEWAFHKFDMHQTDDVHILHHAETNADMSMPAGYNINAIQFPLSASLKIAALGLPTLGIFDFLFQLNIPVWQIPIASVMVAATHAGLWNTLHPDTHDVTLDMNEKMSDSNGASYQPWLPGVLGPTVWNWLVVNHTGHHTIVGNYNCVFPGADCVYGTFYHTKKSEELSS